MRYASVCSGVEAASLAWMPLGWEAVWFSEIEPFPCAVLKERFPDVPNLGDMTEIKGEKYHGTVDLLVGGTPCQGFSVAGKQGGLNDSRSALCLAYCGLLETMRPRWFVWENVPGVFSTNQGEDFRAFLGKIDEIGYSVAWRVLDAQYVRVDGFPRAVPQRRRRVFVVGHLGDWRYPASVLFEPGCLPGDTPPRRVKGQGTAGDFEKSAGVSGRLWDATGVNPTFNQCGAGSGIIGASNQELFSQNANGLVIESGKGFYTEAESAQTLEAHEDQHRRNIICRDIVPTLDASYPAHLNHQDTGKLIIETPKFWNGDDVSTTLTEAFADDRMPDKGKLPCVICRATQQGNAESMTDCCPTITEAAGKSGNNLPLVQECFPINSMIIGKNVKVGDRQTTGIGNNGDPLPTISSAHHHAVAVAENIIGRKENTGANGTGAQVELAYTQNATGVMGVSVNTSVRRLLPVECERLMGFPDNWTQIPWRGKSAEDCPDSPRYKACGNSMCVNVMRWVGMRIENVERRMKGIDHEKART